MKADKTVFATQTATRYADLGEDVIYINSATGNARKTQGGDTNFTSHSSSNIFLSKKVAQLTIDALSNADIDKYSVIVIDEAQFFQDIDTTVIDWVERKNKTVIVIGLDGTYKMEKFGNVTNLISHADSYKKLKSNCKLCLEESKQRGHKPNYAKGPFTVRNEDDEEKEETIKVGVDEYQSVCRYHFKIHTILKELKKVKSVESSLSLINLGRQLRGYEAFNNLDEVLELSSPYKNKKNGSLHIACPGSILISESQTIIVLFNGQFIVKRNDEDIANVTTAIFDIEGFKVVHAYEWL
jgi:thymidine kinase